MNVKAIIDSTQTAPAQIAYDKLSKLCKIAGKIEDRSHPAVQRLEAAIKDDPQYSYYHAVDHLQAPFPEGEAAIAKEPWLAACYAARTLHGPFPAGEKAIAQMAKASRLYAIEGVYGPFLPGEQAMATNPLERDQYLSLLLSLDVSEYIQACVRMGVEPDL